MQEPLTFCDCFNNSVIAAYSSRHGGFSHDAYASLNLGLHVQDDPYAVLKNRVYVEEKLGLPVLYMNQTHSNKVVMVDKNFYVSLEEQRQRLDKSLPPFLGVEADGIVTTDTSLALAVLTADCLPLLLCSDDSAVIAAVHCGWRGLAGGIVENAVHLMEKSTQSKISAFIGPCIGPCSFEIGKEVKEIFVSQCQDYSESFIPRGEGKFLCSLPLLCQQVLNRLKITRVIASNIDTMTSSEDFYSYRKSHVTGRLATIVAKKSSV